MAEIKINSKGWNITIQSDQTMSVTLEKLMLLIGSHLVKKGKTDSLKATLKNLRGKNEFTIIKKCVIGFYEMD